MPPRPYNSVLDRISPSPAREQAMRQVVDLLWEIMHVHGFSWVGFYLDHPHAPDEQRLVLGPSRDTPACSPIGLHGVCGQALQSGHTRIVHDVAVLGANYIGCDPRDRSEIVVPLIDASGTCWAVLDVDSWQVGAFSDEDDAGLRAVLDAAGLQK